MSPIYAYTICLGFGVYVALLPLPVRSADSGDVRGHAEQSFERLKQQTDHKGLTTSNTGPGHSTEERSSYSPDQYLIGKGQGDMAKGAIICQRVSELSARSDIAKQIRILVKEHMIDRIRERSGRDADQDIEVGKTPQRGIGVSKAGNYHVP